MLTCPLSVTMQVGHPEGGRHLDQQGHPLGSSSWTWLCGDTEPLLLPAAWRRAGRGLGWAVPVARRLSGASEPEPLSRSRGCSCWLPARPAAPLSTALQAGQGRAGQAAGALAWRSFLTGSCSVFLCSRKEQQEEEEGAALALCSAPEPGRCPGAGAGGLRLQQAALWAAPGSHLRGGRHAAPAHPGKAAWPGGPQPALPPSLLPDAV